MSGFVFAGERFRKVFAKSSVFGNEPSTLILLGVRFEFLPQVGVRVLQPWPGTCCLPLQRKALLL